MREIQPIGEHGVVTEEDVNRAINGLSRGERYAAADLYARYCDAAKEANRNPGHQVAFGQNLARIGLKRVKMSINKRQVSAWSIPFDFR